ncbi:MAG: TIR domain-containing protein [Oscillospiraceae bacterium]|nr:TIR domain-containing protein [Oscillospiraceae bacterium]
MAIFKCKMCGGDLEIGSNETVAVCEYCNTKQTIPALDNEKKINLFNRANRLRFNNEFDKAAGVYESIAAEFPEEAEAYWGLCLCKYGIEYIDDPKTGNKVPTCHRTSFDEIFSDNNFSLALEYADFTATSVYREEAKEIDRLQKAILDIAKNEEPFDIFICYKETAEDGQRTKDSVLAQDMYDKLTEKGYKVFFSRITLEDKLGKEYEPYIFSALNSAKVMLAVGTKYEYYNAVWVKNEWSRFLDMMKSDKEKVLIPCYADIDAYDMPQEFKNLQGQDMGKIGFMQDLLRGIGKILSENAPQQTIIRETVVSSGSADTAPLLKRAFMFLEDGDFKSAEEYCEKVLDINPECAEAYLGKLMVDFKIDRKENFKNLDKPFSDNINYQKIMRFGDEDLKNELSGYIEEINQRNENERLEGIYSNALNILQTSNNESEIREAKKKFESISDYKDSVEKIAECEEKALEYLYARACNKMKEAEHEYDLGHAAELFDEIIDYRDSSELKQECLEKAETIKKDFVYERALKAYKSDDEDIPKITRAISELKTINGWKDSAELIEKCKEKIIKINELEEIRKQEQEKRRQADVIKQKKRKTIRIIITLLIVALIIVLAFAVIFVVIPNRIYNQGIDYMNEGQYTWAMNKFEEVGFDYKDSQAKYEEAKLGFYNQSIDLMNSGKFVEAMWRFEEIGFDYKDSQAKYDEAKKCYFNKMNKTAVSLGFNHIVGLKSDGTVIAKSYNYYIDETVIRKSNEEGECNVKSWKDITSVSASYGHTVGLKSDGTVVATGEESYFDGVSDWTDIVSIYAEIGHTVGLKSDGTVVVTSSAMNDEVSSWTDIVAVSVDSDHLVGLKSDGTVVATGEESYFDGVSDWTDIVAVSAGAYHTVGLKSDGTVVAIGYNEYGYDQCNVSDWTDIVAVSAGYGYTLGLKSDGTVVSTDEYYDMSAWTDIVAIYEGSYGIKSDGTVVAYYSSDNDNYNVSGWTDIKVY